MTRSKKRKRKAFRKKKTKNSFLNCVGFAGVGAGGSIQAEIDVKEAAEAAKRAAKEAEQAAAHALFQAPTADDLRSLNAGNPTSYMRKRMSDLEVSCVNQWANRNKVRVDPACQGALMAVFDRFAPEAQKRAQR